MPATVPDLEDELDDSRAQVYPCPTCGEGCTCPLDAVEHCDPATATWLDHRLFPCPFFHV